MFKSKLLEFIAYCILILIRKTCRYEFEFANEADRDFLLSTVGKATTPDKNYLLAFFHQDEMSLIPYFQNSYISVLVSASKDGEFLTHIIRKLGYYPVRGSSSKKAVSGLIASIKMVKSGYNFSMAVDGPKGPIYKVKEGIIAISNKTNVPIIPIRTYPQSFKLFNKAWNKAKLPYPFTKIRVVVGKVDMYTRESLESTLLSLQPRV